MDEELIPSYIQIDNIEVLTSNSQGSSSSYITDAWFYVDGADLGAYPLPATIPYIGHGEHSIKIAPGIKLNGISGTRVPYPMVKPYEVDLDLYKDSIVSLDVKCNYYNTTRFALIEDFEDINTSFEETSTNSAEWRSTSRSTDPNEYIFEGSHSGGGFLNEDDNRLQVITKQSFTNLPKNGVPVFIELNFKANTIFVVSIVGYDNGIGNSDDLIYLNPTDGEWKKIYINLTSTISYDVNVNEYKFLISADHTTGLSESIVLIDNFKLLYRDIN